MAQSVVRGAFADRKQYRYLKDLIPLHQFLAHGPKRLNDWPDLFQVCNSRSTLPRSALFLFKALYMQTRPREKAQGSSRVGS